jgi:hypothetical protein
MMTSKGDVHYVLSHFWDIEVKGLKGRSALQTVCNLLDSQDPILNHLMGHWNIDDPGDCPATELLPLWQRFRKEIERNHSNGAKISGIDMVQILTHAPDSWLPKSVLEWKQTLDHPLNEKATPCGCCDGTGIVWK